jgi:hypothetical protein
MDGKLGQLRHSNASCDTNLEHTKDGVANPFSSFPTANIFQFDPSLFVIGSRRDVPTNTVLQREHA